MDETIKRSIMDNYKVYKGDWEIESRSRQNPYIFRIFDEQYEDIQYKRTMHCPPGDTG
jgi:hypothetical protein